MNIFQKIFSLILFGLILFSPTVVLAQSESKTNFDVPEYQGVDSSLTSFLCTPSDPPNGKDLETCINKGYRFGIAFGAISLVFFLVFAGYMYITGGEVGKEKGKSILKNALVGISLLLGSYMILSFINPSLVLFKPIQPPIFTAADMPDCEAIGYSATCVIIGEDGSKKVLTGGYADCPDGVIDFDKKTIPVNKGNDADKICKSLMEKLKLVHAKHKIIVTTTIDPSGTQHDSLCHKPNNAKSGVCADMVTQSGNWEDLCAAINSVGGMVIVNESGKESPSCGKPRVFDKTTGNHLHVYLSNGGGTGGSTSSAAGGSRPYCRPIYKFLCDHPANDSNRADNHVWISSFPEIQKNLNELKTVCGADKKPTQCLGYPINQVYRSPEYGAHMRSIYEAYAILFEGWSDSKVASTGQGCDGSIRYVKSSDLKGVSKDSEVGKYIRTHFLSSVKAGGHFSSINSPTTCFSDHGRGVALDFESATLGSPPSLVGPGKLCRNIKDDPKHYILYSKKKSSETCNN